VSRGGIHAINLLPEDDARIAELNKRYADLPGDCADLTLVTLSERLDIAEILALERCLSALPAGAFPAGCPGQSQGEQRAASPTPCGRR
jgi:predicted nucleic acid-binding protein